MNKIFRNKILIKIYNSATLFLPCKLPCTRTGRKTGSNRGYYSLESNEKVCACALGIVSKYAVSCSHCTREMLPFQQSRKKTFFTTQSRKLLFIVSQSYLTSFKIFYTHSTPCLSIIHFHN